MKALLKVLELKAELDKLRPISKEQEAIIMQKFRLDWNYHSNRIEGNSLSYGETKALILFGITAQGKPLKDHIEITGHNEAVKWIEELVHQDFPMNENFIRQLHQLLLKEPYQVEAITPTGERTKKQIEVGQYKRSPNHVLTKTGEIFRFATPEETPSKMHDLIEWFREKQNESDLNPLILAAEFHYKFIRIHPFDDGNGRLARILMNLILMQYGFSPVIIKTEEKGAYFSVLQQADAGIFEPFVEYIAQNEIHSLEVMLRGAKGENIGEPDDLDKELTLLEQQLKKDVAQLNKIKNRGIVQAVYSHSLETLFSNFVQISAKFERFYKGLSLFFIINNNLNSVTYYSDKQRFISNDNFIDAKLLLNSEIDYMSFVCVFNNLKSMLDNAYSYEGKIEVYFNEKSYIINNIEKPLMELLSDEEINIIVNKEIKKHKEFIESKINEIQQNAGNQ